LDLEELQGMLIRTANGHFIVVLYVLLVDFPDFVDARLLYGGIEDEEPNEGSLAREKPTNNFDVPLPFPPLPLLEDPPFLFLGLLAFLLILGTMALNSLLGEGGVDISTDGQAEGVGIVAGKVVVVRLFEIVVFARNDVYVMDVPTSILLAVLTLLLLRILRLDHFVVALHFRTHYLVLA
jgi:hypothetical protein